MSCLDLFGGFPAHSQMLPWAFLKAHQKSVGLWRNNSQKGSAGEDCCPEGSSRGRGEGDKGGGGDLRFHEAAAVYFVNRQRERQRHVVLLLRP